LREGSGEGLFWTTSLADTPSPNPSRKREGKVVVGPDLPAANPGLATAGGGPAQPARPTA